MSTAPPAHDWATSPLGPPASWPAALTENVAMMMAAAIPSFIVWGASRTLLYNDAYAPILATRHPAAFGASFSAVWPEIWPDIEPLVERAFAGEALTQENLPLRMERKGYAEETWFTYFYTPIRLANGHVGGFHGGCIETTQAVRAHRGRDSDAERQRQTLQQMPGFVAILDGPDHVFQYVNDAYVAIAGRRDFLGRTVGAAFPELVGQGFLDLLNGVYATGVPYTARAMPIRLAGEDRDRFIDFLYHPVRDDRGAIAGIFVGGYDVTEIVRAARSLAESEARYRTLNETLEQRVAERTADLLAAEAQLRQSQKMEAVGQLTGGLAHDFNNLLAGISGSLEMIGTRIAQGRLPEVEKYMLAAQGAARRAAALTHRLLAFSRRQTLQPKATNVNFLVGGLLDLIQRSVGPNVAVRHVAASTLWPTLVDPSQLENALLNLCLNARDAMPAGGTITIETANRALDHEAAKRAQIPQGHYLSLAVADTGTGMEPDVIAKAFDPFFTTKPIGEGTGLGLSMIYGFAKQSGGHVRIHSKVAAGTTVSLYLPRHRGQAEIDQTGPNAAPTPPTERGQTVLVVDDEPSVRMLVADVLDDLGYTAIEAADGATGLQVLQSNARVDLLITDVGLPSGMNGRQLADAARVTRPDLRVLFITGFAETALLDGGQLAPGMSILTKPFAVDTLTQRVSTLIAR